MRFPFRLLFIFAPCAMFAASLAFSQATTGGARANQTPAQSAVEHPSEKRLRSVRQLTFGGENAEAYFSGDGSRLIFQSKRDGRQCDQIYTMRADGSDVRMVSTGSTAR